MASPLLASIFGEKVNEQTMDLENPGKDQMNKAFIEGAIAFDLSTRGKIEVTGPEGAMFLHNLCTNDINGMPVGAGCEAFFANSKARPIAWVNIFHVLLSRGREGFWIDLPPGNQEILLRHLDQHLISEQAEFCDRTSDFGQIHLTGPRAQAVLTAAIDADLPALEPWEHMERNIGVAICHIRRIDWLEKSGYDVSFLAKHGSSLLRVFKELGVVIGDNEIWQALRIPAGLPEMGKEITDQVFIPELGRNKFAVCDTKGCYLGQEPIVMARDRGQINRKLMVMHVKSESVSPGMIIQLHGKDIGKITSVAPPANGQTNAMGFVRREAWTNQEQISLNLSGNERVSVELLDVN